MKSPYKRHAAPLPPKKTGIWEALELLNTVVDASDPDTALPQLQHCLQAAEAARATHPADDWLHLTALIHDLGKVLAHPAWGAQPQWAVGESSFVCVVCLIDS
jgi:inositol oxygenase